MTLIAQRVPDPLEQLPPAPASRRDRALLTVILLSVVWAISLNNGVFIDEAVYVRAGRAYLDHWLFGIPLPDGIGTGFSGLPVLYPVLAGLLDMIGGLFLVRLFSLVCLIVAILLVNVLSSQMFGPRAGLLAAAMFGVAGPVMYVGHLGTFDALVVLLLVLSLRLALAPSGFHGAVFLGLVLAFAVAVKYTAMIFVPVLLVFSLFTIADLHKAGTFREWVTDLRPSGRRFATTALAVLVAFGLLVELYWAVDDTSREALRFTTTERSALSPVPRGHLVAQLPDFAWPLFVCGVLGLALLLRERRWAAALLATGLLGASLLLPAGQIVMGELVSFHKHLAYSAVFLAPLCGFALERVWRYSYSLLVVPLVLFVTIAFMVGAFRSHDLIEYPDVRPVVEAVDFTPGDHLSSSADSLSYYTRDDGRVRWLTTFDLYAAGQDAIRTAIQERRYERVILHRGATGSAIQDEGQSILLDALRASDGYGQTAVGREHEWLIFTKRSS